MGLFAISPGNCIDFQLLDLWVLFVISICYLCCYLLLSIAVNNDSRVMKINTDSMTRQGMTL